MIQKEKVLKDKEKVTLGDTSVVALATPGHTMGTFFLSLPSLC